MQPQTALPESPAPGVQEKKEPPPSTVNKAQPPDEALEKLSVIVSVGDWRQIFDPSIARRREVKRRLATLGEYALREFEKKELRTFAQARFIPEWTLTAWKHAYLHEGLDGLVPQDWLTLKERSQQKVIERLKSLGNLVDAVTITGDDVYKLSQELGGANKLRIAERLIRRYQLDGVWGLAPERDPERLHRPRSNQAPPSEYAAATPKQREEADRRLALITPYLSKRHITNDELRDYAKEHSTEKHSLSWRSMRNYLASYKKWGIDGLLPKAERSDKGHPHNMSPLMEDIVAALRFSQMDIPLHEVHRLACPRARLLGEPEPTLSQVRFICDQISEEVKLVADRRFGEFRSKRRLTYRFQFDGSVIIFQVDFTKVDVLLRDINRRGYRKPSGEIRPWLITCMECSSRLVLSWLLTYEVPNSNNIAAVIRDALIVTDEKPYGGIPHAIWVDQGNQLISHHVQRIAQDLEFDLKIGKPNHPEDRGDPQERGIDERFFGTLKTRLWSTLEGYVDANTKERNPNAKAVHTISELAAKLRAFVDKYHHERHSETGMTPLEFWARNCQATGADPRKLDILMLVAETRTLNKPSINYGKRRYWHEDLAKIPVGSRVEIRAQPDYMRPDTIEVFYEKRWVCSAFAHDSVRGRAVTGEQVLRAQREQMKRIKGTIREKKAVLDEADRRIGSQSPPGAEGQSAEQTLPSDQQSLEHPHEAATGPITGIEPPRPPARKRSPSRPQPTPKQKMNAWDKALAAKKLQLQQQEERSDR